MSEADLIAAFRDRQKGMKFWSGLVFFFPFHIASALAACFFRVAVGRLVLPFAQAT